MPGLQETAPVSLRWAPAGHGDAQGARPVISRGKSLHLTTQLSLSSQAWALYLAAAVGDDRLEEGLRSFLDGPHDAGDVDNGCPAATQSLFCALLGSLLQQRQECLGRSTLVRCLCLQPAPLRATAPCLPMAGRMRRNSGKPRELSCFAAVALPALSPAQCRGDTGCLG